MPSPFQYPLARERRDLYVKIWAGGSPLHGITTALHYLDCHFPPDKLDAALRWLIQNKITGNKFHEYLQGECGGSHLLLHRRILSAITKTNVTHIIHGKDFVS